MLDNKAKENVMGLSASQARFLQLTARRGNIEYEAQQINFQRLALSDKLALASSEYQDKVSNRSLIFSYNNGEGIQKVDLTYENYKSYYNLNFGKYFYHNYIRSRGAERIGTLQCHK